MKAANVVTLASIRFVYDTLRVKNRTWKALGIFSTEHIRTEQSANSGQLYLLLFSSAVLSLSPCDAYRHTLLAFATAPEARQHVGYRSSVRTEDEINQTRIT